MRMQIALLIEPFVAVGVVAHERLLSCVNALVRLQVEVQGEPLVADVTLIWLLALLEINLLRHGFTYSVNE